MDRPDTELRRGLEARAAQATETGWHPEPELLASYHAGDLADEEERRLQDHLVWCRECTKLLLGLGELTRPHPAAAPGSGADEDWKAIQARLPAPSPPAPMRRRAPTAGRFTPRRLSAIAASLLVATLGLSAWVVHLRRTVADLSEPQVNAVIRDLYLADSTRAGEGVEINQVPAEAEAVTLILNPSTTPDDSDHLLAVETTDGSEIWRRQGLRPTRWGTFTLVLPGGFLQPGAYRLRLFALDGERPRLIEEFPLQVVDR